jgi:hypothetical protein
MSRLLFTILLVCLAMARLEVPVRAQDVKNQVPAAAHAPTETIDGDALAIMIKSSILALQHANATGNYSVLRDLGTPIFRERYDQASLAMIFAPLRDRGINLSPIILLQPVLTKAPERTPNGQLLIVGQFDAVPVRIRFELLFLSLDSAWRLDGINVDAVPADGPASALAEKPEKKQAADGKAGGAK